VGEPPPPAATSLEAFLAGEIDPRRFDHREHVRMAYELLRRHEFFAALERYVQGLRRLLERIDRPEVFHATVTLGYLSLIAERLATGPSGSFEEFLARHPELLQAPLLQWYAPERLHSEAARRLFVMPVPCGGAR